VEDVGNNVKIIEICQVSFLLRMKKVLNILCYLSGCVIEIILIRDRTVD
jgi:hypothetical protein